MAERQITFEEIQKGDRIRTTSERWGVTLSSEGVADRKDSEIWVSAEGGLVADVNRDATITLLDRPKPSLPSEPGSIIIATEVRGQQGEWPLLRAEHDYWVSAIGIDYLVCHDSKYITEWRPAKVVEA